MMSQRAPMLLPNCDAMSSVTPCIFSLPNAKSPTNLFAAFAESLKNPGSYKQKAKYVVY